MKNKRRLFLSAIGVLLLISAACSFSATTANIKEAYTAHDVNGTPEATTAFTPDEVFYLLVTVANAPDDTITKAVWKAVQAEGLDENLVLLETEYEGGGEITFEASNDYLWPAGSYVVELYIDDKLKETLEFTVAGDAAGSMDDAAAVGAISVDSAYMARFTDDVPEQVTSYAADEVFYAVVELVGAQSDTKVTAVWFAVDAEGVEANSELARTDFTGEPSMTFNLSNDSLWPAGSYMVEIYVNDEYQGYLDFTVE